MLREIDSKKAARKSTKTVGEEAVVKTGSIDRKTTTYTDWKLVKLLFLKTCAIAVHSNVFSYFTDLPATSSVFIVAQPGFIVQYDTVQAPCKPLWCKL